MKHYLQLVMALITLSFSAPLSAQTQLRTDMDARNFVASEAFLKTTLSDRLAVLDDAIESLPEDSDPVAWARLTSQKVYVYTGIGDYAAASDFLSEVEDKLLDISEGRDFYLMTLSSGAFIYSYSGEVEKALRYIELAEKSDLYNNDINQQFRMSTPIASVYVNVGYAELGADLLIQFYEENKNADVRPRLVFSLLSNIAYALNKAGEYERALKYLDILSDGIENVEQTSNISDVEQKQLKWHLWSNIALNRIGLEQYDGLSEIADRLEDLGETVGSPLLALRSRFVTAAALYGNGEYEATANLIAELIQEADRLNSVDLLIDFQKLNISALKKLGKYKEALAAHEALDVAKTNLETQQGRARVQYLNAQLSLQKKNFEIQELRQFNEVTTKLRERDRQVSMVFLLSAVLLGVFAIALFLSRRKLKTLAGELALREREAIHAANVKSRFLANMSHEIRTPLNALLGITQILQTKAHDPETAKYLSVLEESGQNLLAIGNDILDLSKIEAGKMTISPEATDVILLLAGLVETWTPKADEKSLALNITQTKSLPEMMVDPLRLRQCLSNLISNAIKFTEEGGITIKADFDAAQEELKLTVQDTGIGIAEDRVEKLFEAFVQEDDSTERRFGGTGLGLSIVNILATEMGGSLRIKSKLGKGTRAELTISAKPVTTEQLDLADTAEAAPIMQENAPGRLRLLVVDDHDINRMVIKAFLEAIDVDIVEAGSGQDALNALKQGTAFDGILLDNRMPDMNGIAVMGKIRSSDAAYKNIPIIFVTADAMEGDREKYLTKGANGYLAKPLIKEVFFAELRRVIPKTP